MCDKKSVIEAAWDSYRTSDDKEQIINHKLFYKLVYKEDFYLPHLGHIISAVIPNQVFHGTANRTLLDELGNHLTLLGPEMIRFMGDIPEWYAYASTYLIKGFASSDEIGNYVTSISNTISF